MNSCRRRILHIIVSLNRGGCEMALLRLLPRVGAFDHRILTIGKEGELAGRFREKGVEVESLSTCCALFRSYCLFRYVRKYKPSLIITYLSLADFMGRFFLQPLIECKVVPFLRTTYNYPRYWLIRQIEKLTSFMVGRYLANSEAVKKYYVRKLGVSANKIWVLQNGVDVVSFVVNKRKKRVMIRKTLGIPEGELVLCCVGNLHVNKGHLYLLRAFRKVYEQYNKIWLLLVGDGEARLGLEKEVAGFRGEKRVLFLGKRDDVSSILAASDIFVLPTLFEGMSNALLEAMAAGLPIITTNIKENRELIVHGESGLLVPIKTVEPMVRDIVRLQENVALRAILGKNAHDFVKRNYDIRLMAKRASCLFGRMITNV